ncbi:MAG: helix-turn-helix domain-containing protein [Verrucomicrobiota bacterium]
MKAPSFEQRQSLGCVLASQRGALNFTQEKFAANSGVPLRTIQRAERGDGIGQENLEALAGTLGTTGAALLAAASAQKEGSPELRLKLPEVTSAAAFVKLMRGGRGSIHVGPEGEDALNEHIGGPILELCTMPHRQAVKEADYILRFTHKLGFRLFAGSHRERVEHEGKVLRNPTRTIIAAPDSDERIRKTAKGLVLDYLTDARKQMLHTLLKRRPSAFDWMQEQLLTRSDGENRVRSLLRQLHDEVKGEMTARPARRHRPRKNPNKRKRRE